MCQQRRGNSACMQKSLGEKSGPLITIITVTYNAGESLRQTIESVLCQTYRNFEFIIIDGGSSDGTVEIIKSYEDAIDFWISEKDSGIYNAMNKGVRLASGEWVNFMNSGDELAAGDVLSRIFLSDKYEGTQVIYGKHVIDYERRPCRLQQPGKLENIWRGPQFSHQATFVRLAYLTANPFREDLEIASDYALFYQAYVNKEVFLFVPITVAIITAGGVSDKHRIKSLFERKRVTQNSPVAQAYCSLQLIKEYVKSLLKKCPFLS